MNFRMFFGSSYEPQNVYGFFKIFFFLVFHMNFNEFLSPICLVDLYLNLYRREESGVVTSCPCFRGHCCYCTIIIPLCVEFLLNLTDLCFLHFAFVIRYTFVTESIWLNEPFDFIRIFLSSTKDDL